MAIVTKIIKAYTFKESIKYKKATSANIKHCNTGVSRRVFFKGIASTRGPNKNEIHIGTINKVLVVPTSNGLCVHCRTVHVVAT